MIDDLADVVVHAIRLQGARILERVGVFVDASKAAFEIGDASSACRPTRITRPAPLA
jgi:hypothetical protein